VWLLDKCAAMSLGVKKAVSGLSLTATDLGQLVRGLNAHRLHSALDYPDRMEYETDYFRTTLPTATGIMMGATSPGSTSPSDDSVP
jgi:hypothetical protein